MHAHFEIGGDGVLRLTNFNADNPGTHEIDSGTEDLFGGHGEESSRAQETN